MSDQTRRYALMGHPVAHSLSPRIHNAAFAALGLNAAYKLCDSSLLGPQKTVQHLVDEGFCGWNVTMPDKTAVAALCDELSDEAALTGSVNTVLNKDGHLYGTTTDGQGFLYAVSTLGLDLEGGSMTLLGGGGAAVAILVSAALAGARRISVFCRSLSSQRRIRELAGKLSGMSDCLIEVYPFDDEDELRASITRSCLIANATNVGMNDPASSPLNAALLTPSAAVFDAIYHPLETKLLRDAKEAGCKTANGLPMLIGQAAASFELWTGRPMPLNSLPPLP